MAGSVPSAAVDYRSDVLELAGVELVIDPAGVAYWPSERTLAVADLHFEKASSYARFGALLPPYDTRATLMRLGHAMMRYRPRAVVALGDSFHDGDGPQRLGTSDRMAIGALQRGCEWIWVAGNHDPDPAAGIGGVFASSLRVGPLTFRHEPHGERGEVCGHLHPVARVAGRGRSVTRKCFAADRLRLVLPAFGAFTGGLNIRAEAFASLFGALTFRAHMLGATRLYAVEAARCLPS